MVGGSTTQKGETAHIQGFHPISHSASPNDSQVIQRHCQRKSGDKGINEDTLSRTIYIHTILTTYTNIEQKGTHIECEREIIVMCGMCVHVCLLRVQIQVYMFTQKTFSLLIISIVTFNFLHNILSYHLLFSPLPSI